MDGDKDRRVVAKVETRQPRESVLENSSGRIDIAEAVPLYVRLGMALANACGVDKYGGHAGTDFQISEAELDLLLSPLTEHHELVAIRHHVRNAILLARPQTFDEALEEECRTLEGRVARVERITTNPVEEKFAEMSDAEKLTVLNLMYTKGHVISNADEGAQFKKVLRSLSEGGNSLGAKNTALRVSDWYLVEDRKTAEFLIGKHWAAGPKTDPKTHVVIPGSDDPSRDSYTPFEIAGLAEYNRGARAIVKSTIRPALTDYEIDNQERELIQTVMSNLFGMDRTDTTLTIDRLIAEMRISDAVVATINAGEKRGLSSLEKIKRYREDTRLHDHLYVQITSHTNDELELSREEIMSIIKTTTDQLYLFVARDLVNAQASGMPLENARPILGIIGEYRGLAPGVVNQILFQNAKYYPDIKRSTTSERT